MKLSAKFNKHEQKLFLKEGIGSNMSELIKTWEEREYGPKLAMWAVVAMIIYLVVAQ